MTSQYYPTSIFTNYNHVVFEDTLDYTRWDQHTQKLIYAVKPAEIIQPVMTLHKSLREGQFSEFIGKMKLFFIWC